MNISLDRNSRTPLFMQIRNQIMTEIGSGSLSPGYRLPAERKLAQLLGINRSTVVKAYEELVADGMVEAHVGRGTVVSDRIMPVIAPEKGPAPPPFVWQHFFNRQASRQQDGSLSSILGFLSRENLISFAGGVPDPAVFPIEEVRTITNLIMSDYPQLALDHSGSAGMPRLRQAVAGLLADQGLRVDPERIIITSGSQQCLDILTRVLVEPGDNVIIEEPTYIGALHCFRLARARFLTIPLDQHGMRTEVLEQVLNRNTAKFIYTMPNAHNPAGCTMSLDRRRQLMDIAHRYHLPIIEDDAYGALRYSMEPLPLLASMDPGGQVIYLGSSSKMFFPGLRVGWMAAPAPVIHEAKMIKQVTDLHTASLNQLILYYLLQDGFPGRHLQNIIPQYQERRDAMLDALARFAPPGVHWHTPNGGVYVWVQMPLTISGSRLLARTEPRGVAFMPGAPFFPESGGENYIRLSYSRHGNDEIFKGIQIICEEITRMIEEYGGETVDYSAVGNIPLV